MNPHFELQTMNSLINKLTGTGVAIITPFKKNHDVDFDALEKMIDFVIDGGVEYIVTLGTTGETPTLTKKEQREIVDFTAKKINDRVPLVLGIGGNNTKEVTDHFSDFSLENITAILAPVQTITNLHRKEFFSITKRSLMHHLCRSSSITSPGELPVISLQKRPYGSLQNVKI